ncbi:MAG: class I SAM-dependent methyltransferase [Deltaproteobacteria bacterium]|nr:class I SAM-dependent methyltransferase [Deltaproteobacteria bacterium]
MSRSVDERDRLPRLFTDLAHLWPLLSPSEDYVAEAAAVHRALVARLAESVRKAERKPWLLELGAGGGHTIKHLTDRYDIVAVDLSEQMLVNCRRLNPGVEAVVGDMRDVRLHRTFEAVLVHDAVDYLESPSDIARLLETSAVHLEAGGVVLVAPTYVSETFVEHDVEHDHHSDGELDLTYFSYVHRPDTGGRRVEAILVYLIREGGEVEVVEDRHVGGLFSAAEWLEMLEAAGFDASPDYLITPDEDGGGGVPMFVGIKR